MVTNKTSNFISVASLPTYNEYFIEICWYIYTYICVLKCNTCMGRNMSFIERPCHRNQPMLLSHAVVHVCKPIRQFTTLPPRCLVFNHYLVFANVPFGSTACSAVYFTDRFISHHRLHDTSQDVSQRWVHHCDLGVVSVIRQDVLS